METLLKGNILLLSIMQHYIISIVLLLEITRFPLILMFIDYIQ